MINANKGEASKELAATNSWQVDTRARADGDWRRDRELTTTKSGGDKDVAAAMRQSLQGLAMRKSSVNEERRR